MRIVDIRERTVSIASSIANAFIDFSKMTCSIVAVVTDVVRDGAPVVGYGFNSNGRYGQGALMRERLLPRLAANPEDLLDDAGENLDPFRIWAAVMPTKPGGHDRRSVAVARSTWRFGTRCPRSRKSRHRASRNGSAMARQTTGSGLCGRGLLLSWQGSPLAGRDAWLPRSRYATVKMKIGGASIAEDLKRIEAVLAIVGRAGTSPSTRTGGLPRHGARLCGRAGAYGLFWYEEAGDPLDTPCRELSARYAWRHRHRRELVLSPGCPQPAALRRHGPEPRLAAVRLRVVLRSRRISADARRSQAERLVEPQSRAARWPSDVAQHRGGVAPWR